MKMKLKNISKRTAYWLSIAVVGIVIGVSVQFVRAWTPPSAEAPGNDVAAPINTSGATQVKTGSLGIAGETHSQLIQGLKSDFINGGSNALKKSLGGASFWNKDTLYLNGWGDWANGVTVGGPEKSSNLDVTGDIRMGAFKNFYANGRMHISGDEKLYLLNTSGTHVSNAWGGNGNLTVDGTLYANRICFGEDCITAWPSGSGPSYTPGEWFTKLQLYSEDNDDKGWGEIQNGGSFTAAHAIDKIRVYGVTDDGGYCYAHWGTGHAEAFRHTGNIGYLSSDGDDPGTYYDGSPIYDASKLSVTYDAYENPVYSCSVGTVVSINVYGDIEWTCRMGYRTCPTFPPSFDGNGNAVLCQDNTNNGAVDTGERAVSIPQGTVVYLKGRHTQGGGSDSVSCSLDIQYAP